MYASTTMEPTETPGAGAGAAGRAPIARRVGAAILILVLGSAAGLGVDAFKHAAIDADVRPLLGAWAIPAAAAALAASGLAAAAAAREVRALRRGEPRGPSAARARALVYGLALGCAFQLAAFQPFKTALFHVAAALGLGLFSGAVLAGDGVSRRAPRLVRALDVLLLNLCLVAVLGEISLRLLAWRHPSPLLAQPDATARAYIETFRLGPGEIWLGFPCNRGGHYDTEFAPPPRKTFAVASISDSFAFGRTPHHHHFTTVCERELAGAGPGVEVFNLGVNGIGPREYAYLLEHEALPLAPDAFVVNVYIGNDILSHRRGGLRVLLDRENLLVYQVPRRLLGLSEERVRRRMGAARYEPETVEPDEREVVPPERLALRFPWILDPAREVGTFSVETYRRLADDRVRFFATREPRHFEGVCHHLAEMAKLAGDVPLIVVLIPDETQVEDRLWDETVARLGLSGLERDLPQRVLGEWLASRGIPCVDLLPLLRAVPPLEDGWRHVFHLRDTHFNARGNEVAGKALAAALRPHVERRLAGREPTPRAP